MKLLYDPTRVTHLMKSIRIDMVEKDWGPLKESVAIEPLCGDKESVTIKIYHCKYKGSTGRTKTEIVRFYFNGKKPEVVDENL